jgi:tetratricopeptide (TPR) repeat protein/O-antigen ligase
MQHKIALYLDHAISILVMAVAGLTPLFFLNKTTEFFEVPKLVFLVVAVLVLYGMWIFSWILKGKVTVTRTPLDVSMLFLLGVVVVSTILGPAKYAAIFGNFPRVHESLISWVAYILLYFVAASNLKSAAKVKSLLYVLFGSGLIVAVVTVLSFFGVYLPIDFAKAYNFTPTGLPFSTVAFLLMILPPVVWSIVRPGKFLPGPVAVAVATVFGVTIALVGTIPSYVVLFAIFALCFWVVKPKQMETVSMFLVPAVVTALTLALVYLPFPGNKLKQMENGFPREIQLPLAISWKITASAFRDAPFLGMGPGSYLFSFSSYKPVEFNSQNYWNFSFDSAHNEFLLILATLGVFGLIVLGYICVIVLTLGKKSLGSGDELLPALSVSGVVAVVLLFIHPTTIVSMVVMLLVFAAMVISVDSIREKTANFSLGLRAMLSENKHFDLLPVIIFVVYVILAVPAFYQTYKVVMADYYHRVALSLANTNGTATYQNLQKAESLNPYIDLYRVDLAQTNYALANAIAAQKGPSQASPAGSLTDQDKKTIQTLLSQAITEARVSVALNPLSSRNWSTLGSVYRNITGVAQNALTFSLDAYGKAIQRDPLNPLLRLNVGGIYYSMKNYEMATRFFTDAVNLKPDYANAYFNLAIALRDKGDIQNAKLIADQTVVLLQKDPNFSTNPDFKRATDLAAELKTKAAAKSGEPAPAATTDSALGDSKLSKSIKVNELNNPPASIATPAAVVKNPNAVLPQTTPVPVKNP